MQKTLLFATSLFFLLFQRGLNAQLEGNYTGTINGSTVQLQLQSAGINQLVGRLSDEYQTFKISATTNNQCFEGNAVETNLNLDLAIKGCQNQQTLKIQLDFSALGVNEIQEIILTKVPFSNQNTSRNNTNTTADLKVNRDYALVGLWKQEQIYNSGYGGDYFGGSLTQKVIFFADGSIADAGSQAHISGHDFSGLSQDQSIDKIEGVQWSTQNNQLLLTVSKEGQSQTVTMGKYYIENGKMLITNKNGEKTLLIKIE